MAITVLNTENFETEALNAEPLVVIDFWATWCGPCRMLSPVVDEIAETRTDIKVCKINVDDQPALAMEYGIASIPTLIFLKGGKKVYQCVGVQPKAAILSSIDQYK